MQTLHWIPISGYIKCFNAVNSSGPTYLSELLHIYIPFHTLHSSSNTGMLQIQQYKSKIHSFRTFSYFGPNIFHSFPQDLRHCSTLSGYSSVVRVPGSWLKGHGFESVQEQLEIFLSSGSTFRIYSYFGIHSNPMLPQSHVTDPSHSAKSAGGRLQLNTHAPYVCGFAWSDMVHGCMVYAEHME